MLIIGLSGKIGTGKTHLAKYMIKRTMVPNGISARRYAFGDPVKQEAALVFGFPLEWAYDQIQKGRIWAVKSRYGVIGDVVQGLGVAGVELREKLAMRYFYTPSPEMTIRDILQWWGTEVRRAIDPNYWIKKMDTAIKRLERERMDLLIVDDVRFPGEANLIKMAGGMLIRVSPYSTWTCDPKAASHESETALDSYADFDLTIGPEYGQMEEFGDMILQTMVYDK